MLTLDFIVFLATALVEGMAKWALAYFARRI